MDLDTANFGESGDLLWCSEDACLTAQPQT